MPVFSTVFAALNAKYSHTNPAIRLVAAAARQQGCTPAALWEHNINEPYRPLLQSLAALHADVIVFSLYLWNVALANRLAEDIRKIAPDTVLVAAGPEVCFCAESFLQTHPAFDYVSAGEGEATLPPLLRELERLPAAARHKGLRPLPAVFDRRQPKATPLAVPRPDMDALAFPYDDLTALHGRTLYYESMRGCPFRCSYCLSSIDRTSVRFRSLPLVFADLERFLAAKVRRVKFVDRTFNCDPNRAAAIWQWLDEHDNGITGFHFEIAGHLLDDRAVEVLRSLRPGLVQLEIGVQSCNPPTLTAIRRPEALHRLWDRVAQVQAGHNVHLHLDVIAGLPEENYACFADSFNRVYAAKPHQLQLGFLKVLHGAAMERDAARYGIVYSDTPPYEVLQTKWLSFADLCRLHGIDDMVDLYYNSGRFSRLITSMQTDFPTPFAFYEALAEFRARYCSAPLSKLGQYEFLGDFLRDRGLSVSEQRQWLCRYDMASHEKPKASPRWVQVDGFAPQRTRILSLLDETSISKFLPNYTGQNPKAIIRSAHIEIFPFHPVTGDPCETAVLFDYTVRNVDGRAKTRILPLSRG